MPDVKCSVSFGDLSRLVTHPFLRPELEIKEQRLDSEISYPERLNPKARRDLPLEISGSESTGPSAP